MRPLMTSAEVPGKVLTRPPAVAVMDLSTQLAGLGGGCFSFSPLAAWAAYKMDGHSASFAFFSAFFVAGLSLVLLAIHVHRPSE